nr:MAG TPA: hypothetical protein [Caudoviricetes sp.]
MKPPKIKYILRYNLYLFHYYNISLKNQTITNSTFRERR